MIPFIRPRNGPDNAGGITNEAEAELLARGTSGDSRQSGRAKKR
jgi:hypothetical protein